MSQKSNGTKLYKLLQQNSMTQIVTQRKLKIWQNSNSNSKKYIYYSDNLISDNKKINKKSFSKNNLTPRQPMRCTRGSLLRSRDASVMRVDFLRSISSRSHSLASPTCDRNAANNGILSCALRLMTYVHRISDAEEMGKCTLSVPKVGFRTDQIGMWNAWRDRRRPKKTSSAGQ